jgi:hypothetical protein
MPLGIYLTLDQTVLFNKNYSDVSGFKVTGTIYSDVSKTSAFNITGYTLTLRLFKEGGSTDYFDQACTATVAASGTWYISVTENTLPPKGFYLAVMELSKSGTVVSSLNRVEVLIQ